VEVVEVGEMESTPAGMGRRDGTAEVLAGLGRKEVESGLHWR